MLHLWPERHGCSVLASDGAETAAPVAGAAPAAGRRPAVRRDVPVASATENAEVAGTRPCRIRHRTARIVPIPIRTPLPYVPVHVVKSPRIRLLLPHRMRPVPAVVVIPPHILQLPRIRSRRPCPARILPLRLRRQRQSRLFAKLLAVVLECVVTRLP